VAVISLNRLLEVPRREPELYSPLILLKEVTPRLAIEVDEVPTSFLENRPTRLPSTR
jgi:hypothetical protein